MRHTITRAEMDMPLDTAEEAARQAHDMPDLAYVVLNCWGEPTLNPHVLQIVPMFAGLRSVLSTNCVEYVPGLKRSGMSELILSTDVDGIRAVNALRYLEDTGNPKVLVQLLITTSTQHKVERFIEKFKPRLTENAKLFIKYPVIDPSCEVEPLRDDLYQFVQDDVVVAGEPRQSRGTACDGGISTAVVQADGDVMLHCCSVNKEMVIGRLGDGVLNLFNNDIADRLRSAEGVCGSCTYMARCPYDTSKWRGKDE
jgi:hypothetical protein